MDKIIINDDMIDYIFDCIYQDTAESSNIYYYNDNYHRDYIFPGNGNDYRYLYDLLDGKSMKETIDFIGKLNIPCYNQKIIHNYFISTLKIDEMTKRIDELEKLVYCQNDKMNILIDALDLANQNNTNVKK